MHAKTKFGITALLLLSVVPAHAITTSRHISVNGKVETAQYPVYDYYDRKLFSYNKVDPNPTGNTVFSDFLYENNTSRYQRNCSPYSPVACYQPDPKGFASTLSTADIGTGSIKAKSINYVNMQAPHLSPQKSIAENNLSASLTDRITFTGIAPGTQALVKITDYAAVKTAVNPIMEDPWDSGWVTSTMSYTSRLALYDNQAAITSETIGQKFQSEWKVCNDSAVFLACGGSNTVFNGYRSNSKTLSVDSDDVLFIYSQLSLSNLIVVSYLSPGYGTKTIIGQRNDFGSSGYTLIEMLTPGAGYISESGGSYLTSAPSFVPEPASWAMLIAGFGFTGAAMRRRRQATQPKRVTA